MEIIASPAAMTAWSERVLGCGQTIALVATMGFLHEGHLSLMRTARERADHVVVSLFVNPTQFAPTEDLAAYPRNQQRDIKLSHDENVAVVFNPVAAEMYPPGSLTRVVVGQITDSLCGTSRPGHFDGVATVVSKLFNLVKPQVAVFGEKDFQQLAVIRRMTSDLNFNIAIVGHPIVREADGLALSSRNTYLSVSERQRALALIMTIRQAGRRVTGGMRDSAELLQELRAFILGNGADSIDYINIVDKNTLVDQAEIDMESQLILAVQVGKTRLIDNDYIGGLITTPVRLREK